jgi:hypothetical protein
MFVQPLTTSMGVRFLAGIMFTGGVAEHRRFARNMRTPTWLARVGSSTSLRMRSLRRPAGVPPQR